MSSAVATDLAVEVVGVTRTFGQVQALAGIDLEIRRGEVLGLLGPNGSGKTTTVSVLSTLLRPTSGRVSVCGHDVVREPGRVREAISLTGQFASMDEGLTSAENLALFGRLTGLGRREVRGRVDELVRRFDLEAVRDRRVSTLSGGMRRRVDIAGALVTRPEVVFLDEPTTGLDPRSRATVWESVSALRDQGITVLLTTQYLEEADRLSDRVVMLGRGTVVASGTPSELKRQVGASVCEIVLSDATEAGRVATLLDGFEVLQSGDEDASRSLRPRVVVRATDGTRTVAEALGRLRDSGVEPAEFGLRQPSLDEVFLHLTGDTA